MKIVLDMTTFWNRAQQNVEIGIVRVQVLGKSMDIGRVVRTGGIDDAPLRWYAATNNNVSIASADFLYPDEAAKEVVDAWIRSIGIQVTQYGEYAEPIGPEFR